MALYMRTASGTEKRIHGMLEGRGYMIENTRYVPVFFTVPGKGGRPTMVLQNIRASKLIEK